MFQVKIKKDSLQRKEKIFESIRMQFQIGLTKNIKVDILASKKATEN